MLQYVAFVLFVAISGCMDLVPFRESEQAYVEEHAHEITRIEMNRAGVEREYFEPGDPGFEALRDESLRVLFNVDQRQRGLYPLEGAVWENLNESEHVMAERSPEGPMRLPGLDDELYFSRAYFVLSWHEGWAGNTVYTCWESCNDKTSSRSFDHFRDMLAE